MTLYRNTGLSRLVLTRHKSVPPAGTILNGVAQDTVDLTDEEAAHKGIAPFIADGVLVKHAAGAAAPTSAEVTPPVTSKPVEVTPPAPEVKKEEKEEKEEKAETTEAPKSEPAPKTETKAETKAEPKQEQSWKKNK